MTMSIFGINHVKDIDLLEEIKANHKYAKSWIFEAKREDLIEFIDFKMDINDKFDCCVRIALKDPENEFYEGGRDMYHVFEPAHKNIDLN